ncbi:GNAT family N-acetyltransferase [uncultured Adlercreutzia sp.]|uniref:GNAT family N-acetyltransferase n=2 Tax=uncultured Adlercreutzia sp. TaxID=875803 RepID=UPI0025F481FB|nr:GNAT family N-acetyltransferase [uncultured Adlercreutzia sp.]
MAVGTLDNMQVKVTRPYREADLEAMTAIWNEVVEAGNAFPQTEPLTLEEARTFFAEQSHTAVATVNGQVRGLYILHPNNVGRCGHVSNASFAVASDSRGEGIGRLLVEDALRASAACGFRGLQFNAVVASNTRAQALYESLGFTRIGMIPGGFLNGKGVYEDMFIYYHETA